ncbi:glutamine amidotransferase [Alkalicoccus halolimnae]|uniref:Glutamine amidotransferase n=1 Tax=Alkalicoccus halolimnae TaxID=1667239 RepID=A0A5C7F408_9BACI|nr:glutamine amidotransferase [Alkalicoccus halolimnae]TXF85312.1 cytoplasmic protein [Alkalicoccus halolimnae]
MKLLFVGESWTKHTIHVKGFDSFTTSEYEEGAGAFLRAMKEYKVDVTYIRAHEIDEKFPSTYEEIKAYDAVILSDIGSNSFLLANQTFNHSQRSIDKLQLIEKYVRSGGGFGMIGGYMSFQGIDGKAKFKNTVIEKLLPVFLEKTDDRVEKPEGVNPKIEKQHEILNEVENNWPHFLGYNELKLKPHAELILSINEDPLVALGEHGEGRSFIFSSDLAPHWGPKEFVEWQSYPVFWKNIVSWVGKA